MGVRRLEHLGQFLRHVEPARDEASAAAEREGAGIGRAIDRTLRGRRRGRADAAGRRVLAFGQAVDLVVEQQDLAIEVAAQDVHRVVAADRHAIAIARHQPDIEFRVRQLDAGRKGGRTPVDRVETVAFDVIGKAAGTADAADEDDLLPGNVQLGQHLLHLGEDRVVAATRTPAHCLV